MSRARIAVLASGGGSNMQALDDHFQSLGAARGGDIMLVASNRADAGALERAARACIETCVIPDDDALGDMLAAHRIDFVVLAGYLKLIPPGITQRFAGRMVNVHPAPLPAFGGVGMYGARAHRAVLASGVKASGPTVHFVDEVFDHGATIAHWPVPVLPGDDAPALAARVLRAEHLLFPRAVQAVASRTIVLDANGHPSAPLFASPPALFDPAHSDVELAKRLDALLLTANT